MSEQFWLTREASGAFSEYIAVYDREAFQQYEGSYAWIESAGYIRAINGKEADPLLKLIPPGKCVGPFRMESDKFVLCDPPVNEEKKRLFANAPAEPTIGFPSTPEPSEPSITSRLSTLCVTLTDASGNDLEIAKSSGRVSFSTSDQAFHVASKDDVESLRATLLSFLAFDHQEWCA